MNDYSYRSLLQKSPNRHKAQLEKGTFPENVFGRLKFEPNLVSNYVLRVEVLSVEVFCVQVLCVVVLCVEVLGLEPLTSVCYLVYCT